MKKTFLTLTAIFIAFTMISCSSDSKKIKRLQKLEEGVSNPNTVEELEDAISKYGQRAEDLVLTDGQLGIWYKILGTRYVDKEMYGKALPCFQQAIGYYPDNANLFYYVGVCASHMANASLDFNASSNLSEKKRYYSLAESSFLRCLELDSKQYRAMYSLGVLYVFNLNESEKAIPYMEKYVSVQKKDSDGLFVLAAAYYVTGQFDKAIELYDRIVSLNPNAQKTAQAKENRSAALSASGRDQ